MALTTLQRALGWLRVDFPTLPLAPSAGSVALASVVALAGSLACDAGLVAIGQAIFPSLKGFSHFRLDDYATLTVIGVLFACGAWPAVTRVSSAPRWLLVRMAAVVTLVLWLPDVWILVRGEPAAGVAVLMVMHLAIATVTVLALAGLAPARRASQGTEGSAQDDSGGGSEAYDPVTQADRRAQPPLAQQPLAQQPLAQQPLAQQPLAQQPLAQLPLAQQLFAERLLASRAAWAAMIVLISGELVLGVVALLLVPESRPSGVLPPRGALVYLLHALVGIALSVGALGLFGAAHRWARRVGRDVRLAVDMGIIGIGAGALGGAASVDHGVVRWVGMALMLAGTIVAVLGYVLPLSAPPSSAAASTDQTAPPEVVAQVDQLPQAVRGGDADGLS